MYRIAHSTPAPIVGALLLLAGTCIPVGAANAATRVVGNCNDSGAGSLRAVVAAAASGDVIDLRPLSCGKILLTSGSIAVPQASLTILGRTRYGLTIDGNRNDRVFLHTGTGTLRIDHVSVANGQRVVIPDVSGSEYGGCIYSDGNVRLHQAWVHSCRALQEGFIDSPRTFGGGISAEGDVHLTWSAVFDNQALENGTGGGIYAKGRVMLHHSQVYQNTGYLGGGFMAERGASVTYSRIYRNRAAAYAGLYVSANLLINKSTISNNLAEDLWRTDYGSGGGFGVGGTDAGGKNTIIDSTISNNRAHTHSAGYSVGTLHVYNSTIAFNAEITNRAGDEDPIRPCELRGALGADVLHLESTIVARNSCVAGPVGYDISVYTGSVIGENNLIEYPLVPVPADTLAVDPRLAPLTNNGGYSSTHMPLADSPVLQRGSNLLNRAYDQRGPGFPRVKGGAPDIGSIER
ncbi:choice-of-anchor Q domain-containing protein [Pseudoxanthomonas sp. UTMC 1351]|uniref:choice-of-anchor Q domain-containing protein n=1 Tax=Pseudoxanthomonas sp. UTMC 1351 TaxID=2695853 RepID=UPI0034CEB58B